MDWNIRCKVEVSWNLWNFWSLRQSDLLLLWSRLAEIPSISIYIKSKYFSCDVYCTHIFTIIHVHTFHRSKGDFTVCCAKIWNHYIVLNLIDVVYSTEECCASSMKLWVPKKVILFFVYLSIILTLFILSTLFDKDYTRISYIIWYDIHMNIYNIWLILEHNQIAQNDGKRAQP